jgi:hypothetical protein
MNFSVGSLTPLLIPAPPELSSLLRGAFFVIGKSVEHEDAKDSIIPDNFNYFNASKLDTA